MENPTCTKKKVHAFVQVCMPKIEQGVEMPKIEQGGGRKVPKEYLSKGFQNSIIPKVIFHKGGLF